AAAAGGTVTEVVIDYGTEGLGCYVTIDHGNGYQTTYAQCSDIYVTPGTYVEQGQTVAAVGSTGDSTGPHLHFEIIANGEYVNPANYLY
ncbi:MAG: M23 family metallopeptidase, partial [Clostridia bacterium]|nr:M23 family metallopeptidase [Clostridia bacterium]